MAIRRGTLYWGVFFLVLGTVVLIGQTDLVSDADIVATLRYWPLVFVALGAGLVLRRTRLEVAGGMVAAAAPALLIGGLIVAAPAIPRVAIDCGRSADGGTAAQTGTFTSAASVDLRLDCGELTVATAAGNDWRTEAERGPAPVVTAEANSLSVASSSRGRLFDWKHGADRWRVVLPTANPIDLRAQVNAGSGDLFLADARLGSLDLDVNAGAATVHLPATGDLTATVEVDAGSVHICAPAGLGLRVHESSSALASIEHGGLVLRDGAWESPDYGTAVHHADVFVTANVGSVDIDPKEGCK